MLSTLLASAFLLAGRTVAQSGLLCPNPGSGGMTQSGDNNYVIDTFADTLNFTYAINQCTGVNIQGNPYIKYTCTQDSDDVWWVTKTSYSTADCSGTGTTVKTWSESDVSEGEWGYFKCDGKNNYAAIDVSIDAACGAAITIVGGLGGCAYNARFLDSKFYCDASTSTAYVQLYDSNHTAHAGHFHGCDDEDAYCMRWSFTDTCAFATDALQIAVYGKYSKCSTTEAGNAGNGKSSASSQFTLVGIVAALIVGFWNY